MDTEASLMLLIDAKRGRHGVFADFLYSDVQSDEELVPAPINLALHSITKTTIFSLAYQYEIFNRDQAVIDVLVGARYWNIDSELRFGSGTGGPLDGRRVDNDESWIDPVMGVKGRMPLGSSKFYIEGGAPGWAVSASVQTYSTSSTARSATSGTRRSVQQSVTGCSTSITRMTALFTTPDSRVGSSG